MKTDPEPVHEGTQVDTRDAPPPATGPMETEEPSADGQARLPSHASTPRSRPRTTASTHPSGMWFCPMPRCARREGASPTGWSCLQSLGGLTSAQFTYQQVRPRRTHGLTPMSSVCAWPAGKLPLEGRGARDHAAPRRYWRRWPWATRPPPSAGTLATGRATPGELGPGAPAGNTYSHAAHGPHRGLLHVRPGANLLAAGPGTGADMGDHSPPSPIPPHRPRSPPTGRQGNEVLFDPAMSAQLPGSGYGPLALFVSFCPPQGLAVLS